MLKQFAEHELLGQLRSAEQQAEIRALEQMGDESIDLSDIPEIRTVPPGAVRGKFYSPGSVPVYLDPELQTRLLAIALRKGISLSELVGRLLRKEIEIAEVLA
jgi:predicted HicB family RNase H-like nuclease